MTTTKPAPTAQYSLHMIPIAELHESPTNPRRSFDPVSLAELTASIRQSGLLNPITARAAPTGGFEIVAGARRFRACREAGMLDVPAMVHELTDKEVLELQVVENLQRSDLHPLDEALGFQKLHGEHGYSVHVLAEKVGKSESYIYSRMQLAEMPPKAQLLFLEGKIDLGHATLVARIPVPALADEAAAGIAKGDYSSKPMSQANARDYVRRNYQCDLKNAPFDTAARDLVTGCTACGPCPKRTGNQSNLFGAVEKGGADICTDPKCFDAKASAAFSLQAAEVERGGGKVLVGKAADKIQYDRGDHVDLDSFCLEDPKCRTWRKLIGAKAVAQLPKILGKTTRGDVFERVPKKDLVAAVKASGKLAAAKKLKSAAPGESISNQQRARDKRHKERLAIAWDLMPKVVEAIAVDDKAILRGVLLLALECVARWQSDGAQRTWKRREMPALSGYSRNLNKANRDAIAKLSIAGLQGLIVEVIASTSPSESYSDAWSDSWRSICELAGIDLKKAAKTAAKAVPAAKGKKAPRGAMKQADGDTPEGQA